MVHKGKRPYPEKAGAALKPQKACEGKGFTAMAQRGGIAVHA
jgi:hypothetical protein